MMQEKIILMIEKFVNNKMVLDYIKGLLASMNGGLFNFDGNICEIKNVNDDYIWIFLSDSLCINSNICGKREEMLYSVSKDGASVQFNRIVKLKKDDFHKQTENLEEEYFFDNNMNLIKHSYKRDNIIYNIATKDISLEFADSNYELECLDYVTSDRIVRIYSEHSSLDENTKYYVGDCEFDAEIGKSITLHNYTQISLEIYNNIIKKIIKK